MQPHLCAQTPGQCASASCAPPCVPGVCQVCAGRLLGTCQVCLICARRVPGVPSACQARAVRVPRATRMPSMREAPKRAPGVCQACARHALGARCVPAAGEMLAARGALGQERDRRLPGMRQACATVGMCAPCHVCANCVPSVRRT